MDVAAAAASAQAALPAASRSELRPPEPSVVESAAALAHWRPRWPPAALHPKPGPGEPGAAGTHTAAAELTLEPGAAKPQEPEAGPAAADTTREREAADPQKAGTSEGPAALTDQDATTEGRPIHLTARDLRGEAMHFKIRPWTLLKS